MAHERRRPTRWFVPAALALLGVVAVAACGGGGATDGPEGLPLVVVTTSILGDVVQQVAGDGLEVDVLMGAGVDPHEYQPSARDAEHLRRADLVVVNGGHLEGTLLDAVAAAHDAGVAVFTALDHADPLPLEADPADPDPHFWQDPRRMALVVDALGPVLGPLTPGGLLQGRAEAYAAELRALDAETAQRYASLPEDRRTLVTDHDAFGYLADRYDFTVIGVIIPGGGTGGQASARDLAQLAEVITQAGVRAVFSESTLSSRTAEALAREAGHDVRVVQLHSDALGPASSDASSYAGLVRTNADRIIDALG